MTKFDAELFIDAVRQAKWIAPRRFQVSAQAITDICEKLKLTRQEALQCIREASILMLRNSQVETDRLGDQAEEVVREWLKESIQLIEHCYKGSREDDPVEGNQDYQALKRVLDFITPPSKRND